MEFKFTLTEPGTEEQNQEQKKDKVAGIPTELQKKAQQKQGIVDKANEVYARWQEANKNTELLQADLLKGTKAGADITQLYLRAVLALSLAVDNTQLYNQVAEDIYNRTGVTMSQSL